MDRLPCAPPKSVVAEIVDGLMPCSARYPRPNWEEIAARITRAQPPDENSFWRAIAERWMEEHCRASGTAYSVTRTENFLLAGPLENRPATNLITFAERARRGIARALKGLVATDGLGPHVILVFETEEEYYEYIAPFYPEGGQYGVSSGVQLNPGYTH